MRRIDPQMFQDAVITHVPAFLTGNRDDAMFKIFIRDAEDILAARLVSRPAMRIHPRGLNAGAELRPPRFDAERMILYRLAVAFVVFVKDIPVLVIIDRNPQDCGGILQPVVDGLIQQPMRLGRDRRHHMHLGVERGIDPSAEHVPRAF